MCLETLRHKKQTNLVLVELENSIRGKCSDLVGKHLQQRKEDEGALQTYEISKFGASWRA